VREPCEAEREINEETFLERVGRQKKKEEDEFLREVPN